ncbi:MAG TPA: FAD:protein FMN transferase, partial [Steroidobacteraceae bacterium]|nr:FAD:protein FMN transferase [Steroidobacteraceae bacterium]
LAAAWDAIQTVERVMHPERAGSCLAELNNAAPGTRVELHPWTWEVLQLSRELHAASEGAFDPCLPESAGRLDALELIAPHAARLHARLRIDLGGIAKGYAVDRALAALRDAGAGGGLVNAGGDLAVFGTRRHRIHCDAGAAAMVVELTDAALASSAADEPRRPPEHRGYYHGADVGRVIAGRATVLAPRAVWADGLAKCALVCAPAQCAALLTRFGARLLRTQDPAPGRCA